MIILASIFKELIIVPEKIQLKKKKLKNYIIISFLWTAFLASINCGFSSRVRGYSSNVEEQRRRDLLFIQCSQEAGGSLLVAAAAGEIVVICTGFNNL